MVACKCNLEPVLIFEGDSECEVLVVQVKMKQMDIRVIAGYGAQECAPSVVREKYRSTIEEQVVRAYLVGCEVLIAEDANAKLGPQVIPGDPHTTSENGKLLLNMINRQNLSIVNASTKCKGGPVTRKREAKGKTEESCIDFVLVSPELSNFLASAFIDKNQIYTLTKYTNTKGNPNVKRSDHFPILATFEIEEKSSERKREDVFKLRDEAGLAMFKQLTTQNNKLRACFQGITDVEAGCEQWYKQIDKIIHQCFKKMKITDKPPKNTVEYSIFTTLNDLKTLKELHLSCGETMEPILRIEIGKQEQLIAKLKGDRCKKIIFDERKNLLKDGTFSFQDAWKLKKKLFPRSSENPFAVLDKNGILIANYDGILDVMKDEFTHRLRNREINQEYSDLRTLKEYLCKLRLEITARSEFDKWTMENLQKAIDKLRSNKCKDPHGHINELYKNMGQDGLQSLLDMLNLIKEKLIIPGNLNLSNVSTIYKGKGSMQNVLNLRGIFKLPIIRNLLDRMVYYDEKQQLCQNMGHFQVGNQGGRNIRDNTLVVHAVVNEALTNKQTIDIQFTDIKQCFDSIWLDEATNDLFDSGVTSRSLNILYEGNRKTRMCVETSFGRSERVQLNKVVMQGSVPGGAICSNQLSKLCNKLYKEGDVYMYRNKVPIPALAMVDDIACICTCNSTTSLTCNVKTDSFVQRKKLESQVGEGKCQWVHIGENECRSQYKVEGNPTTLAASYKYLGDYVSNGWNALYEKRLEKSVGYSVMCEAMCSEVSMGFQMYNYAKLLHTSIFINGSLLNMETWPNCTTERIEAFEKVEQSYFRKILHAHSKTPIEAIYLELGVLPLRYHLMRKRILYFKDIMERDEGELTKQIIVTQMELCNHGDFYAQVQRDMSILDISEDDILTKSKEQLKSIISQKTKELAYTMLIDRASKHSKVNIEAYPDCSGAKHYNNPKFTPDLTNLLFKFRTRTYLVKNNFRNNYRNTNILCPLCDKHNDDQEHLLLCETILQHHGEKISSQIEDIFSEDEDTLYNITKTLSAVVKIRQDLLEGGSYL